MTDVLFLTVLNMSLTASCVILSIVLVRLPLKKAPKIISYALWSVAAFRLLCPFSFKSILSLVPVNASTIPKDIAYQQTPQITSGIVAVDNYVNGSLPAPAAVASVNPLQIYTQIGVCLWLLGVAAMLAYSVVSVWMLKNRLKSARHIEQNIYEAVNLKTPFVLGIFRPRIFLPAGLAAEEKGYILRHEQTHIRRFDHIIKPFAFLILSIHWFNPLVWLAFVLMGTDMELSCDERVIREMGGGMKKAYSSSLLSLATEKRVLNGSPLAFGEGKVKGRIQNVLHYRKPAFWAVAVTAIAATAVGIGLMANPAGNTQNHAAGQVRDNGYQNKKQPVRLSNFTIAENVVTLFNGNRVSVRLVMTNGEYFEEEYAGAGGGIYPDNYQGSYQIEILDSDGTVISKTNFENEGQPANFAGKFDLLFDDYNHDGNPDFSIGQWGSSSMNLYQLYTILPDGTVQSVHKTAIANSGHDFSIEFNQDHDSGFYAQSYNNATGETVTVHYLWNQDKNSFEEASK